MKSVTILAPKICCVPWSACATRTTSRDGKRTYFGLSTFLLMGCAIDAANAEDHINTGR
jgi:hypothetical protein